jgi:sec-independent protein translocase protein TatB
MGTPQTIQFASLGMADSLILMVLALVVFGPRRLPQIGRQIGKLMYEFRKASNDFKFQMEEELRNAEEADRRKKEEERLKTLALAPPAAEAPAAEAGATASPYPWESVYPSTTPAAEETQTGETTPQILPPSTGETVAAEAPNSVNAQAETAEAVVEEAAPPQANEEQAGGSAPEPSPDTASEASPTDGVTQQESGAVPEHAQNG